MQRIVILLASILLLAGCTAEGYQAAGAGLAGAQGSFEAGGDEFDQASGAMVGATPFLPPPWNSLAVAAAALIPLFRGTEDD